MSPAASPVRVIVVEDERLVARELKVRLNNLGYEVPALASSAEQAIQLVRETRPALVLMDIRLEGDRDGIEAARIVRERFAVPVVFLTAHADNETLRRASATEPFGYLLKPFDDRELKAAIEIALYKHGAEKRLGETRERLLRAHRIARLGDWEQDLATREIRASEEACHILGIECEGEALLTEEQMFARVHPEDRAALEAALRKSAAGQGPLQLEHRVTFTGQAERFVRQYGETLPGRSGAGPRLLGAVQDITEYKRLEERFQRAQKLEAVGRLAGGVAHDFNNLLVVINGYSDMILSVLRPDDPLRAPAEQILKAGERASALTRQLMTFSGRRPMRPKVVNLNALIDELDKMLRRLLMENIEVRRELAPSLWPVCADLTQIEQVIMNLVVNASDAMPDGGVLTLATSNAELAHDQVVWSPALEAGRYVRLSVTDSGAGMSAETKHRIFEPFFTTKAAGQGTGLGLSTVYGIVKQHGGDISVSSELGRGSRFTVYLPASNDCGELPGPAQPRTAYAGTETILVVEDDEAVRDFVVHSLRRQGYDVLVAGNGSQALDLANRYKADIHLLLTDMVMPELGGQDLVDRIRRLRPDIRVVFMSGYPGRASEQERPGPDGPFLQKPFDIDELGAAIRAALDKRPGR